MEVIKRTGEKVEFNFSKIEAAVTKAFKELNQDPPEDLFATLNEAVTLAGTLHSNCLPVEDIQDIVEDVLMRSPYKQVAKAYITYRYKRQLVRESNTTDKAIKELLEGENDYWNNENSNKNAKIVTTQRDYLAGITSTDIARRFLLPKDIVKAHDEGIIHFHDMDYFAQNALNNCCLINLKDCLENGTVINGVLIEPQHRFSTACTVATQIITAVASSQYGGCTITLSHLAPFVRKSWEEHLNKHLKRGLSDETANKYAHEDLVKEIKDGVQTFNYQVNSMTTTNGQAPFLSVNMYVSEDPEYQSETALLIEEFLKQRIQGFKNEKGVYVTPAFPKLLYVLEECNITPDSDFYYLTELAAECTAKRMVPDYISEKVMKELKIDKNGNKNCYPCINKPVPNNSNIIRKSA